MEGPDRPRLASHVLQQAEALENRLTRRLQQEPSSDRAGFGRPLEDRDLVAIAGEGEGGCGATHPEAGDRDPHEPSNTWYLSVA